MRTKYELNDIVECGRVIGIIHPQSLIYTTIMGGRYGSQEEVMANYDNAWGTEWRTEPTYSIWLNEPTRQMSYEDFIFHPKCAEYIEGEPPEKYREIYEKLCPPQLCLNIPEHLIKAQIVGEGGFNREEIKENSNGES